MEVRKMEKLFSAIRDQHPGFEVVDFRLLANQHEVDGQDVEELDEQFAGAVRGADGPMSFSTLA
jgi:hypothetical protein